MGKVRNVLFLCSGNTSRSPGAEYIAKWLKEDNLPKTVSKYGNEVEEIFICYEELKAKYGKEIDQIRSQVAYLFLQAVIFPQPLYHIVGG